MPASTEIFFSAERLGSGTRAQNFMKHDRSTSSVTCIQFVRLWWQRFTHKHEWKLTFSRQDDVAFGFLPGREVEFTCATCGQVHREVRWAFVWGSGALMHFKLPGEKVGRDFPHGKWADECSTLGHKANAKAMASADESPTNTEK